MILSAPEVAQTLALVPRWRPVLLKVWGSAGGGPSVTWFLSLIHI